MLTSLRRRYDGALNLLEKLLVFEREMEKASAPAIRRVLVIGGRLRPNDGHRPRKRRPA
jgi:hypothetical protein